MAAVAARSCCSIVAAPSSSPSSPSPSSRATLPSPFRSQAAKVACSVRRARRCLSSPSSPLSTPRECSARRSACFASASGSSSSMGFKVGVLGAGGGIGQPLSLLLKMSPYVSELTVYDIANTKGVAADLSHCNTPCHVSGYVGNEELGASLRDCDLVIIPAGVPRKPGMTRDDLFNINAGIVRGLVSAIAEHCPNALINIISNPVNSTVPIAAEILKKAGKYDPKKLMGVTTLDIVRANTFLAEVKSLDVKEVDVPVVGGHAGASILPLLSQATPAVSLTDEELAALTTRIQNGGTEVVEAKAGAGSATLSMAYAAARFAEACLKGLSGEDGVIECTFVESTVTELPFFSSKCRLGPGGVEEVMSLGELSEFEKQGLAKAIEELKPSIEKGLNFVNQPTA